MLENRSLPADLKKMNAEELSSLCEEIRQEIVSVCLQNGGHLGASLGTVEIAVALHRIFDSPKDKIIWDVGHQAYAHKLVTGRAARFKSLRTHDGISGFLVRDESKHDLFGAGHSSTSLSAALGFAYQSQDWTVAIIGDGGLTAGVAFEALNNVQTPNQFGPMLVILNDNQMSISENVGGIHHILSNGKAGEYFGLFGFDYVGPADGHDLSTLLATLNGIRSAKPSRPILLHLMTQKGKGYSPAEARPAFYHGVGPVQPTDISGKTKPNEEEKATAAEKNWSDLFCEALIRAAEKDPKIVAITAAMGDGTGLLPFANRFPDRFFDVGIAEPHAATFAAGLAANGWKPVCAIYSTFLQRSFDAIIHDIALQKLPVVFAVDRAGLVGADGPTHHGVFDLAYVGLVPGTKIFTPEVAGDLQGALVAALASGVPSFVRYPRGKAVNEPGQTYAPVRMAGESAATEKVIVSYGPIGVRLRKIIRNLPVEVSKKIAHFSVLEAKPAPTKLLDFLSKRAGTLREILFFEDGVRHGSLSVDLASQCTSQCISQREALSFRFFTYPDRFISHGNVADLEREFGRTDELITKAIRDGL
jgi:1-deoxy-D-xylulose-5-phosphate synthase